MLSSPGVGHLIPVHLLGNRLAIHHGVDITLFVVTNSTSQAETQLLRQPKAGQKLLDIVEIPPPDISCKVDPSSAVVTRLCAMMRESLPAVRSAIAAMKNRPDALIVDIFGTEAFSIADEFHIPKYVYISTTAWFSALTIYCHVLDKKIVGQYVDQKEPLLIPGFKPIRPEDVVDPMLDRNDQQYLEYVRLGKEFALSDGILINTWEDLERISLKALHESITKIPVYPIGPLRTTAIEPASSKGKLIEWLDKQPSESILYVSFGSGWTLSAEQTTELAWGLELSQQRFLWVIRPPTDGAADQSYFTSGGGSDDTPYLDFLPNGFISRTHNLGLLVPLWAPQVDILNHPSTGGFLSHCGWNSTLESITCGVPMIAWPLYAEQRLNATMLTEDLGVAVRPAVLPTKKVVKREEIEKMVRTLMQSEEGEAMRKRVKELRISAEKALTKGGSSYNSTCEVVKDCLSKVSQ